MQAKIGPVRDVRVHNGLADVEFVGYDGWRAYHERGSNPSSPASLLPFAVVISGFLTDMTSSRADP